MRADDIDHGASWSSYQRCRRSRQGTCEPCKAAARRYQNERRARPEVRAAEQRQSNARTRALWKLAGEHPDRFRDLYEAELDAAETKEAAA